MGIISTQFISYHEIDVNGTDLIEDAFSLNCDFHDVTALLQVAEFKPGEALTKRLIERMRDNT